MPRDVSVSAIALKSLAPDKKPGTMTAALIRGSKPVATVAWHSNDASRRRAMPSALEKTHMGTTCRVKTYR
jgi:hypothetical protein